jgi:hypothetical protein
VNPPASLGGAVARWLRGDEGTARGTSSGQAHGHETAHPDEHHASPWYATLWLTGVDYFSSLGYAPGLAYLAAGYVAPLATVLLVLVTFFAAVPVYMLVAKHSGQGEGSIKMIERLTTGWGRLGWFGKSVVLALLGFAMTDFVITITLSSADATLHIVENPLFERLTGGAHLDPVSFTAVLILLLCAVFLKGFKEAIGLAVVIAVPYMLMNYYIVYVGVQMMLDEPRHLATWWAKLEHFDASALRAMLNEIDPLHALDPVNWLKGTGPLMLIGVSALVFPKLALGMSGFETGVSVMPLVKGKDQADRVRNTRKLLITAAVLMSVGLLGSSITTAVLIPPSEFGQHGAAHGRALAYLAHTLVGPTFGTAYDLATVAILWFAGASAMAGLLNIIPRYLPRFGMSPAWLEYRRPLVLVITLVCLVVNWQFSADVEAQGGAYATGVLVLMSSGAFAVMLAEWSDLRLRVVFGAILAVFVYVLVVNVIERPDGLRIAGWFVLAIVVASLYSRWARASELRVQNFSFVDGESRRLWNELREAQQVVIIPLRTRDAQARKTAVARSLLHLEVEKKTVPVFLHVDLTHDPSNFSSPVKVRVHRDAGDTIIEVHEAVAVANAIAYVAIELHAEEVVIGLLDSGTPVVNALMYLLFGTGEVGYAVRSIFTRIRDERLGDEIRARRAFDRERDQREKECLRDMIDATAEERKAMAKELFEAEQAAFQSVIPTAQRLPRLILVG